MEYNGYVKRFWCYLGYHKNNKWRVIKFSRKLEDTTVLEQNCIYCGKISTYKGPTEVNLKGYHSPYTFKH